MSGRPIRFSMIILLSAISSNSADAAGFMIRENSAAAVGMSYAGTGSRAESAETSFSNPAGLTYLSGDELEFGTTLVIPDFKFNGTATAFGAPISGNNGGNFGRPDAIPNVYGSYSITDDLKAGFAVTVPFGNASEYDGNWYGRYLATKTVMMSYDINPSVAYRLTDALSLGAGVSAQYLKVDVSRAIDQSIIFGVPVPDATSRFNAHDWAIGFNLGALAKVGETTRVGLTYRSGTDHNIKGKLDFADASPLLGLMNSSASSGISLPATTGLSFTNDVDPNLTIYSDVQFTQWSVFKDIVIKSQNAPVDNIENFRNAWMVAAGAKYKLNSLWEIMGGVAWDQSPVTSSFRTVNLPDTDRYVGGTGLTYQLTDTVTLDGAYSHAFAFLRPTMNVSANNTDSVTHAVVLKGQYDVAADIVAASIHYRY
jgi:long-chain fatty acid transport protein